jgi:serine protease Do
MPRGETKAEGGRRKAEGGGRHVGPCRLWPSAFDLLLCGLCVLLPAAAHGQTSAPTALPAALERPEGSRPEQRAQLGRELQQQAHVLEAQSAVLKIVAKLAGPAVVHIEADFPPEATSAYGRSRRLEEDGSGVIIQQKGAYYVLTNRHVVRDAAPTAIRINLADGRRIQPTKVSADAETDVAVLAISGSDLVAVPLGDSDRVEIGDFVLAVGSPFGLNHSVTFGIISAKGRRDLRLGEVETVKFQDFLQTDAAINPGNSGGPLVNLRGEVIGINTAIASNSGGNEGVGFSIPINMFMTVARQLIDTGKVTRAFLGVRMSSRAEFGPAMATELGLPRPMGAHIKSVMTGSGAEAANLQPGDVILEFDHTPVEDDTHLANVVSLTAVGKRVPLLIFRDRKPINVTVEVSDSSKFAK